MTESGAAPSVDEGAGEPGDSAPEPSWWHRSHPTFAAMVGFFTGVAFVIGTKAAGKTRAKGGVVRSLGVKARAGSRGVWVFNSCRRTSRPASATR